MPYIFGYGSLIEQASRLRTTPSAMYVLPARARGFARGWWARTGSIGFTTTFVGAIPEKGSSMNGVVYAVSKEELEATNKREQGYTPTDITNDVEILSGGSTPKDKIWIYVNKFKNEKERQDSLPTADFPIVQSYVDICLTGCLQIQQGFPDAGDFAREFIESTQAWSKYWENDRVHPRRPFVSVPLSSQIDALLQKHLPKLFAQIQLAPGHWQQGERLAAGV
ncbi:MAG TPA: gamma-glutamylcyclotransferase family protein [Bryobacteraceae bacterium]|nr:gamma-glutamylcyclotransferase family protein [Bryobacteraceae bacterium]